MICGLPFSGQRVGDPDDVELNSNVWSLPTAPFSKYRSNVDLPFFWARETNSKDQILCDTMW
jgi:hypothetical protein